MGSALCSPRPGTHLPREAAPSLRPHSSRPQTGLPRPLLPALPGLSRGRRPLVAVLVNSSFMASTPSSVFLWQPIPRWSAPGLACPLPLDLSPPPPNHCSSLLTGARRAGLSPWDPEQHAQGLPLLPRGGVHAAWCGSSPRGPGLLAASVPCPTGRLTPETPSCRLPVSRAPPDRPWLSPPLPCPRGGRPSPCCAQDRSQGPEWTTVGPADGAA